MSKLLLAANTLVSVLIVYLLVYTETSWLTGIAIAANTFSWFVLLGRTIGDRSTRELTTKVNVHELPYLSNVQLERIRDQLTTEIETLLAEGEKYLKLNGSRSERTRAFLKLSWIWKTPIIQRKLDEAMRLHTEITVEAMRRRSEILRS